MKRKPIGLKKFLAVGATSCFGERKLMVKKTFWPITLLRPKGSFGLAATLGLAMLSLAACAELEETGPLPEQLKADNEVKTQAAHFAKKQEVYKTVSEQFTDLPVPSNVSMNLERTLVLGPTGAWLGRLVLSSSDDTTRLFDFFKAEMPGMGWHELTAVRAIHSVLSYSRLGRIATIQILPGTMDVSEVVITASPERPAVAPGAKK
jgi:hypothetical protein